MATDRPGDYPGKWREPMGKYFENYNRFAMAKPRPPSQFDTNRAYADQFPPKRRGEYTVNIPGIQDFIRLPALEDKALRQQRYERYKNSTSAAPGFIGTIGNILTALDDAQDLLFTALALAWPLLRRLPALFLGPIGWLLFANDLLNVMT